jgi:hypothetical protein
MALPKLLKILLAIFVTVTSISMAAVAAWDRGGTLIDKSLLVSMSVVIVLAVHLLPAISRRTFTWLIWAGCLACAIYGHLTFLTHSSIRAGESLAKQSVVNIGTDKQIETVTAALAQIKARPVTEVMAQLAQTNAKRERAVLREEIAEGKKAEILRNELIRLFQVSTTAKVNGATDPVTAKLSQVFGWSEGVISVAIGLTFSMLIELVGSLIWYEALRPAAKKSDEEKAVTTAMTQSKEVTHNITGITTNLTGDVTKPFTSSNDGVKLPVNQTLADSEIDSEAEHAKLVSNLKLSIHAGKCKATVASIRQFLSCSQNRAQELRRQII